MIVLIKKRYDDNLILDIDRLELTDERDVMIYRGDTFYDEVFVDLEGQEKEFEKLKPYIVFIAKNLSQMDFIAQKYHFNKYGLNFFFDYEIAYVFIDTPNEIILRYYGIKENTEFDVVFEYEDDKFILKSFGTINNIPYDWDKNI